MKMKYSQSIRKGMWLLFVLLLVFEVSAQQVSQKEAVKAAIGGMIRKYPEKSASFSESSVSGVFSLEEKGNCLIYEVCFKNGQKVFLSGNKSCLPVLGYVDSCTIESTQIESAFLFGEDVPDGLKLLLNNYAEQNRYCFDNNVENEITNMLWDGLQQEKMDKSTTVVVIPPLISTRWGQSRSNDTVLSQIDYYAYNYEVPNGTDCPQHCLAGCGAVAMAQIMKYWNEPVDNPSVCAQFDWNNMPDKLFKQNNSSYTNQRNAVAKLIHECGVEAGMNYCSGLSNDPCSSGNTIYGAKNGFHNYGFTNSSIATRASDDNVWMSKLFQELFNNRPIYYVGHDISYGVGHAFVCDGYYKDENDNQYFHFNWGWRGNFDGLYTISNLCPDNYAFNYNHSIICSIYPTDCWENIIMQCNRIFAVNVSKYYSAQNRFSNNYHNYVINSGASVHLQAGEEILLTDGFYAAEGSEFTAIIAPCGSSRGEGDYLSELSDERVQQEIECNNQTSSSVSPLGMVIFPNPVTGSFSIQIGNPSEKVTFVEVFNTMGGMVLKDDNAHDNIDVSVLHKGMYVVRVKCSSGIVYYGKFVKE